jgi:GNAT superfamily N-acetyltransferase
MTMFIRFVSASDLNQLRRLADIASDEGFKFLHRLVDDFERGAVVFDDPAAFFLCVVDDGNLIAVGGVTPDPYMDNPEVGRIRHVYVHPQYRSKSVGRNLMREIEVHAKRAYSMLRLRTDTNAGARFYESLGYQAVASSTATHALP